MPYDRKKTDGFDTKRNIKNRSERSDTQRIRKSPNEKPFAGKRQTERKDYRQFEYHPDDHRVLPDQTENGNEYILTGRNPIREALKNGSERRTVRICKGNRAES